MSNIINQIEAEQMGREVPDFNPRGCQKGACFSDRMYDAARLRHPMKRVGKRGEGKWQRVSWDEALTDIADQMIDVLRSEGPGSIYWDMGGGSTSGGGGMAMTRSSHLLDTLRLDIDSEVGDHHPGANITCGKMMFASSADDCFYSDLILIWGGNPVYTQIPNAQIPNAQIPKCALMARTAPRFSLSNRLVRSRLGEEIVEGFGLLLFFLGQPRRQKRGALFAL